MSEETAVPVTKTNNARHISGDDAGVMPADSTLSRRRSSVSSLSAVVNERTGLLLLVGCYLALTVAASQLLHFSRALDEGYHLEYISFIKQNGRLPNTYEERAQITRADFPPLYHLLVTLLSFNVDVDGPPEFKYFWDSFRYRAIDHQADGVWTLETEDTHWPYLGQFLVWQIGRWTSIVLSTLMVMVVFLTLREIPPLRDKPWLPLFGAAILAFTPRYLILGASLNDDNLLGLLAAIYFWMLVKVINKPGRWWPFVVVGITLGLSMTVKYTLVLVPLEILVVCAAIAVRQKLGWWWGMSRVGLVAVLAFLGASWWFGWNIWYLNTVAEEGWGAGLLRPMVAGGNDTTLNRFGGLISDGQVGLSELPEDTHIGTFPQWGKNTFITFWGMTVGEAVPWSPYVYVVTALVISAAAFGLWGVWQTDKGDGSQRRWLLLLLFHVGLFVILPLIRFGLTRRLSVAAQGRHILIPAAAAVVALLVWGLARTILPRYQRLVFTLMIGGLLGWSGMHLYRMAVTGSNTLPMRTVPEAAAWLPNPANIIFGEAVELASYNVDPQPENGLLHLELGWRALAYLNESYLLKVTLMDEAGTIIFHWIGYNGNGRLPTLSWDPGDSIFDRLVLPLSDLPAEEYRLEIQLLDQDTLMPIDQTFSLPVMLDQPVTDAPTGRQQSISGVTFSLWQANGPAEKLLPNYRYPATISVISNTSNPMQLLDPEGQRHNPMWREANIHTFVIGPHWLSGPYRLQVSTEQGTVTTEQAVLTVENWWKRQFEVPEKIEVPDRANFANQFEFLGYTLPQKQVKAGEAFPLTLYWRALPHKSPEAHFIQFNNLLDSTGKLFGGYDRIPLEYYSTLLWAPGEVVVDGYAVPVEADASPGEYYLDVGYYLVVGESAVNLPLVIDGQMSNDSSVTIGPIEVVMP